MSYTAIVLDTESQDKLRSFVNLAPLEVAGWEILCHHVTVNMGAHAKGPMSEVPLGTEIKFTVVAYGCSDKVVAALVITDADEFKTVNANPHITLMVNRSNGGKPMMSNAIVDWDAISPSFTITGTLQEVE